MLPALVLRRAFSLPPCLPHTIPFPAPPPQTRSNKIRKIRTPGGKLTVQYITKAAKGPTCFVTRKALQGIPRARPFEYSLMKKSKRTVTRAYGGVLSAGAVKDRIVRAFLAEEQKEVKKIHPGKRTQI